MLDYSVHVPQGTASRLMGLLSAVRALVLPKGNEPGVHSVTLVTGEEPVLSVYVVVLCVVTFTFEAPPTLVTYDRLGLVLL